MPDKPIFHSVLAKIFPSAIPENRFINQISAKFSELGFQKHNSIACVGVCRDELTYSLFQAVEAAWGPAFNISSLAGMIYIGKTGFNAAHTHSPYVDERERYIYFAMPHIAISDAGEIGVCSRPGLVELSNACGALELFRQAHVNGDLDLELHLNDLEYTLLKSKLTERLAGVSSPDLLTLTQTAYEVILSDLEEMIGLTVDNANSDYAVITGIQIHGPEINYVSPGKIYGVVNGEMQIVNI